MARNHALGSTLVALIPIVLLLILLPVMRMSAWRAVILGAAVTIILAITVWGAPVGGTFGAWAVGAGTGIWSIDWITFWGVIIYNTLVRTGAFDDFKRWLVVQATRDVRVQAILLAWALGAPIIALSAVTKVPLDQLSASVGRIVAILALLPPWILILLVTGRRGLRGAWPLAVVGSLAFILGQLPASQFLGPYLPDIIGAVVCFGALLLLLRFWRPKETLGFGGVPVNQENINYAYHQRGRLDQHIRTP